MQLAIIIHTSELTMRYLNLCYIHTYYYSSIFRSTLELTLNFVALNANGQTLFHGFFVSISNFCIININGKFCVNLGFECSNLMVVK